MDMHKIDRHVHRHVLADIYTHTKKGEDGNNSASYPTRSYTFSAHSLQNPAK